MKRKPQPLVLGLWGQDRQVENEEFLLSLLRHGLLLRRRTAIACLEHASRKPPNPELSLAMAAAVHQQWGLQVEDTLVWCVAVPRWVSERPRLLLADAYNVERFSAKDDPRCRLSVKDKLAEVASDLGEMTRGKFMRTFGLPTTPQEYERLLAPVPLARVPAATSTRYAELKKCRTDLFKDLQNPILIRVLQKIKHGPQLTVEPLPEPLFQQAEPRHCLRILGNGAQIRTTTNGECPCIVGTSEALEYMVKWIDRVARSLWLLTCWAYITWCGHALPPSDTEIHETACQVLGPPSLVPF